MHEHTLPRRLLLASPAMLLALGASAQTSAQTPAARDIVVAADRVRNPGQAYRVTSTLTEYVSGRARDSNVLSVYAKEDPRSGQFRNLIRYIQPPRDAGKIVLLDNNVMWFYDPASKTSVRISPQQRLIGQASIGDVLTVNFAIDYTAELTGSETVQDAARKERVCHRLDMKAATALANYARVEYWIEKESNLPIKAKFYADSGRLLKILYYRGFSNWLDRIRPAEAVIIDAVDTSLATTVTFSEPRYQEIPDIWFQRDYLPRLVLD